MFPDHQITSKLEVRRAKGKPTQTHAGFAKWGWRLGINVLVPGAGRVSFGIKPPSIPHIWRDRTIALERASRWAGDSDNPSSGQQVPAVPVRLCTGLEARLMYGGLLSPFWVGSSCYQRWKETSEECAQARSHLLSDSSIFT